MALSQGTRLGHYEIVAPLGAGGMGEVYRTATSSPRALSAASAPVSSSRCREAGSMIQSE